MPLTEMFVVVVVRTAAHDPREWHGRAEHVRTGTKVTFASAEELLAFLRRFSVAGRDEGE